MSEPVVDVVKMMNEHGIGENPTIFRQPICQVEFGKEGRHHQGNDVPEGWSEPSQRWYKIPVLCEDLHIEMIWHDTIHIFYVEFSTPVIRSSKLALDFLSV